MSTASIINTTESPMYTHSYRSVRRVATHKEVHCLFTTLTDKALVNREDATFSILPLNASVLITCAMPSVPEVVTLETNTFELMDTSICTGYSFSEGDIVQMHGAFCYSTHRTSTNKKECPVDALGNIKPALRNQFLAYLTKATGVDCEYAETNGILRLGWSSLSQKSDKVWLNDVILIRAVGPVVDPVATNSLAYRSIGRRRSYGLGFLHVSPVDLECRGM